MRRQIETAAGSADRGYPSRWGTPLGRPYSEERAAWIRRNVRVEEVRNLDLAEQAARALRMSRVSRRDARLALEAAKAAARL